MLSNAQIISFPNEFARRAARREGRVAPEHAIPLRNAGVYGATYLLDALISREQFTDDKVLSVLGSGDRVAALAQVEARCAEDEELTDNPRLIELLPLVDSIERARVVVEALRILEPSRASEDLLAQVSSRLVHRLIEDERKRRGAAAALDAAFDERYERFIAFMHAAWRLAVGKALASEGIDVTRFHVEIRGGLPGLDNDPDHVREYCDVPMRFMLLLYPPRPRTLPQLAAPERAYWTARMERARNPKLT